MICSVVLPLTKDFAAGEQLLETADESDRGRDEGGDSVDQPAKYERVGCSADHSV